MNNKKINWLFLILTGSHIMAVLILTVFRESITIGIVSNLFLSQGLIFFPTLIFLIISKTNIPEILRFRKIHISSCFMIVLFTYLMMPLITTVNAISMFFTENVVATMTNDLLELPFLLVFFILAIMGPINEELVLRGVIYEGYKKSNGAFLALIMSAVLFGLIHMNLNQAIYAMILGVILILLKEATDSLWGPIIFHMVFNGHSAVLMFLSNALDPDVASVDQSLLVAETEMMLIIICFMAVVSVVTIPLGVCVLGWLANKEGRKEEVFALWKSRKENKNRIITIPLVIGVLICLSVMIKNF